MPSIKRCRTPEPAQLPGGMTEFEANRQALIASNQARLAEIMAGLDTSLLQKQPPANSTRRKVVPAKRRLQDVPLEPQRRSSRISNLPTPMYEVDVPDRPAPKRQKLASGRRRSTVQGEGGRGAVGTQRAYGGAYALVVNYKGWEAACGEASGTAAGLAFQAAKERLEELQQEGKAAFLKDMTISQVSGGFWCQAPRALADHWAHIPKGDITIHCDEETFPSACFGYNKGGDRAWKMVWLPRDGGAGFSGGWRGFAIDQRLHPNDFVVVEVVEDRVLKAHLFRAVDYETEETRAAGLAPADWYTKALQQYLADLDPDRAEQEEQEEEGQGDQQQQEEGEGDEEEELPQSSEGSKDVGGSGPSSDQQQAKAAAGARASRSRKKAAGGLVTAGSGGLAPPTPRGEDAGVEDRDQAPRRGGRKQPTLPAAAAGAAAAGGDAADMEVDADGDLSLAAAAGEEEASGDGFGTEQQAAAAAVAATAATDVPQKGTQQRQRRKSGPGPKKAPAAAAAAGGGGKGRRSSSSRKRAAGADAGPSTPPPQAAMAAAGSEGEEATGAAADVEGDMFFQLALQRSRELGLPPPTEEERAAAAGAADFHVQQIMGFQVVNGQRQYLVRWHGFGPAWDLWSVEADLLLPPRTYLWSGSIPAGVPGSSMRSGNQVRRR